MAQLKTYSRKARLIDSSQDVYNSSQESFFDSPDDPYFFDSQHSTGHVPSVDDRSTLLSSSSDRSATGAFCSRSQLPSTLPAASVVSKATAPPPSKHARLASPAELASSTTHFNGKQAQSASLSRLSQSSSAGAKPASALSAQQKRSSTASVPAAATGEGPAPKKARLKRSSSSSFNQARNSGSSSSRDKPQQAPATTVLEVSATWVTQFTLSFCMTCKLHCQIWCTGTREWRTYTNC